jgi:hypothetical protein
VFLATSEGTLCFERGVTVLLQAGANQCRSDQRVSVASALSAAKFLKAGYRVRACWLVRAKKQRAEGLKPSALCA